MKTSSKNILSKINSELGKTSNQINLDTFGANSNIQKSFKSSQNEWSNVDFSTFGKEKEGYQSTFNNSKNQKIENSKISNNFEDEDDFKDDENQSY